MKTLTLLESQKILGKAGIPFAKSSLAKNIDEASIVANNIGYPVVLKIVSPQIIHKTEVGVETAESDKELEEFFKKIITAAKRKFPKAKIDGILIQKKILDGIEVLIGGKFDHQFGQVVAFGLGGVFVEAMGDISFRIVPLSEKDAKDMVEEIKGYKILSGFRGKKYDIEFLIKILLKVSNLLEKNSKIKELDINPIIALKKRAVAVDARIIME